MRRILALMIALLAPGCGNKEPLHNGEPASYWRKALQNPDVKVRREAVTALATLSAKEALPELIAVLKDNDAEIRSRGAQALWSIGNEEAKEAVPATGELSTFSATERTRAGLKLSNAGSGLSERRVSTTSALGSGAGRGRQRCLGAVIPAPFGSMSKSRVPMSTVEMPSTIEWWTLLIIATRPPSRPSMT